MSSKSNTIARYFGALLLVCAVVLLFVNPKPAENLPEGFYTPIIAFEFIQSQDEVLQFFDIPNPKQYIASMLLGNYIDYLFMCLYSGLLFFIAIGIQKSRKSNAMYLVYFFCVVMLLSDGLENYQILRITENYKDADISGYLSWLNIFTWLKWSAIASTFLLFSPYFLEGNLFRKFTGFACIVTFGLCIAANLRHGILNEIFAGSIVLVFLLLVIFVFTYKPSGTQE